MLCVLDLTPIIVSRESILEADGASLAAPSTLLSEEKKMSSEAAPSSSVSLPSLDVVGILEREGRSIASSPSGSSMISELDLDSSTRQSPFASILHSSPSSPSPYAAFHTQRSVELAASLGDSDVSRSSIETAFANREALAERLEKYRRRKRANSSDSSGSNDDGSEGTVGGASSINGNPDADTLSEDGYGSRKQSLETPIRQADMPRGRLANIRRESSCTPSDEMAHERLVKAAAQVTTGWDEALRIGESESNGIIDPSTNSSSTSASCSDELFPACTSSSSSLPLCPSPSSSTRQGRVRVPSSSSLSEPISILTNAFLPHSCSPSPTRMSDNAKQCYSPSTQKIVRPNIPYSPSPSPTASPTRKRLMSARSQSPIASRQSLKRRCETLSGGSTGNGGNGNGVNVGPDSKRACIPAYVRNSTSPLVHTDSRLFPHSSSSFESSSSVSFLPKRPTSMLLDPEYRRASMDSYSDVDVRSNRGEECDSLSEPNSVLMPVDEADQFASLASPSYADAYLFRAPSVPPLSVESTVSSNRDDRDATIGAGIVEESLMDEEEKAGSSCNWNEFERPEELQLKEEEKEKEESSSLSIVSNSESNSIEGTETLPDDVVMQE